MSSPKTRDTRTDCPGSAVLLPFLLPVFSLKTSQSNRKTQEQSPGFSWILQQESDQRIPSPLIPTTAKSPLQPSTGDKGQSQLSWGHLTASAPVFYIPSSKENWEMLQTSSCRVTLPPQRHQVLHNQNHQECYQHQENRNRLSREVMDDRGRV